MHSGGLELKKLTFTRLKDNLIRHRGESLSSDESQKSYGAPLQYTWHESYKAPRNKKRALCSTGITELHASCTADCSLTLPKTETLSVALVNCRKQERCDTCFCGREPFFFTLLWHVFM